MSKLQPGAPVRHSFLGEGLIVQRLAPGLYYVLWDNTPPAAYNCGVNPSVALAEDLRPLQR